MTAKSGGTREAKLAAALKENLKRRKAQGGARGPADGPAPAARSLGTAPQAGLENPPQKLSQDVAPSRPKGAPKTI